MPCLAMSREDTGHVVWSSAASCNRLGHGLRDLGCLSEGVLELVPIHAINATSTSGEGLLLSSFKGYWRAPLGFEPPGRFNFDTAYNVYMGLPGDADRLELTVNVGRDEPYDLGEGYNHMAIAVQDIDASLTRLAEIGVQPEKPPYRPGGREDLPRIASVADPDGYRIELIDGGTFETPQDPV